MALFDFLKRKKQVAASREPRQRREKARQGKKPMKEAGKVKVEQKEKKQDEVVKKPSEDSKKASAFSYEAIDRPHISEKATYLMEKNQYIFKVPFSYNKNEIKKSVEGIYGVDVLSVNIIKIPPKKRRIGMTQGFKKGFIKAVVKIKQGQKIEIL